MTLLDLQYSLFALNNLSEAWFKEIGVEIIVKNLSSTKTSLRHVMFDTTLVTRIMFGHVVAWFHI